MKKCEICLSIIENGNSRFCSKSCYYKSHKIKPDCYKYGKGYIKPVVICPECGGGFVKKTVNHTYCSGSCWKKTWEKNNPDYYKESGFWKMRFKVFSRDKFKCVYCGRTPKDGTRLEVEHIHPRSRGGENTINNYVTSCHECNIGKGDILLKKHEEKYVQKLAG